MWVYYLPHREVLVSWVVTQESAGSFWNTHRLLYV